MVLKDGSGAVIDVVAGEKEFAKAMAAPEPAGPPVVTAPAPPAVDPEAPYGRKVDGTPKTGPGGRPPKNADKPRVQSQAEATATNSGEAVDYTTGLLQVGSLVHAGLVLVPPMHPQAALWKGCLPQMATAWNYAAQCNPTVKTGVAWLATSDAGWIAAVALATLPLVQGSIQLWSDPHGETAQALRAATGRDIEEAQRAQADALLQMAGAGAEAA